MTREEVFAAMTTMQCWLNSERIQVSGPCGFWVDVADNEFPSWDWSNYRWRVKPHTDVPHGCDCCDPTHDSPDPVVVRLEREVELKGQDLMKVQKALVEALAHIDVLNFDLFQCRSELTTAREIAHRLGTEREELRAEVDRLTAAWKAIDRANESLREQLAAAEARVTKLTEQLALRLRAEGCDREELLKECIANREKLAAAEAAMENARDVARLIFEKATFIGTAKEHSLFPGWQKIAEMYTWLAQQEDDTAAKGGRDE